MEVKTVMSTLGTRFGQIAWVVRDIQAAETFFRNVTGMPSFTRLENLRADELEGTYYGEPGNFVFHLYLAYSGETLLELIQPVSGQSIFQDFLEKSPNGGVQHIAYMVPEAEFETVVSEMTRKGYSAIQCLKLPVARVAFFDTTQDIGLVTEIIGVTEAGIAFVQQLKSANV